MGVSQETDDATDGRERGRRRTIDLRGVTTTLHPDADVHNAEDVGSQKHEWLHDLHAENLGLDEVKRSTVDLNQTTALLAVGNSGGILL